MTRAAARAGELRVVDAGDDSENGEDGNVAELTAVATI